MGTAGVHFSDRGSSEQELNGVKTGFGCVQAFESLEKIASGWKEASRLDVQLLRAICVLSAEKPTQASDGFSAMDVAEAIGRVRRQGWSDTEDKERVSDDVRRLWNKLLGLWPTKEEGIRQALCQDGTGLVPSLIKDEGGGAGRLTRYRIGWNAVDAAPSSEDVAEHERFGAPTNVRYICEDIEDAGFLVRALGRGYRLEGWRRWVLQAVMASSILVFGVVLLTLLLPLMYSRSVDGNGITGSVLGIGVFSLLFWSTTGRVLRLVDNKIVMAPWWMQSVDDDRLLERREPPRFSGKSIKAVRYTTTCPVCRGKISVKGGGIEFWGRLVGRCEHAPVEHVFSFDHVTRDGRFLR